MGCFIFGGGGKKVDGDNLNFSQVTMEPQFGLAGKKFFNKNKELKTGTILNWDGTPLTLLDGETVPGADVVEPSLSRRYIPSGKYLGKPVELAPMPQGSAVMSRLNDQTVRLTKTAGYIGAGTEDMAIPKPTPTDISQAMAVYYTSSLLINNLSITPWFIAMQAQLRDNVSPTTLNDNYLLAFWCYRYSSKGGIITAGGSPYAGYMNNFVTWNNDNSINIDFLGEKYFMPTSLAQYSVWAVGI